MKEKKVIIEPGYYELYVRYARQDEKGRYYQGAGGLFERHTTLFNSVNSFLNYIQKKKFDDDIVYDREIMDEVSEYYGYIQ
ncbi:MAG: hypothetical protein LBE56_12220 [Tannerella sp.]|jgi:hypothetical protein|nr:hypothetical protein [Tannerella sp.]